MLSSQILKGILEPCILMIISKKESYGYEIVQGLNQLGFKTQEGTVYPILLRLEKKGLISSERRKSEIGPVRKYLRIEEAGLEEIENFKLEWKSLVQMVEKIIEWGG